MPRKNRKRIFPLLLFCLLSVMLLIVSGCGVEEDDATYTISGEVDDDSGDAVASVTIKLTCDATSSPTTDSEGTFSFSGATDGTYTLIPSLSGYTFDPVSTVVIIDGANVTDINFVATATGGWDTYSISGTVTGEVQSDVKLTLSSTGQSGIVMTDSDGIYTFANLVDGLTYTVTPSRSGYIFTPASANVTLSGGNVTDTSFVSSLSD
ncbi:MAG: carboxypeptidase-like regulatory domain-containing protein [Smithella sp.]|jgi:hypothetical protein